VTTIVSGSPLWHEGVSPRIFGLGPNSSLDAFSFNESVDGSRGSRCRSPERPDKSQRTSYSSSEIAVSWTASTDNVAVTGYKVLRNGIQVGVARATAYSDRDLAEDTTYSQESAPTVNRQAFEQLLSVRMRAERRFELSSRIDFAPDRIAATRAS
jgi:hypothetical protein